MSSLSARFRGPGPRVRRFGEGGMSTLAYIFALGLVAIVAVSGTLYTGVSTYSAVHGNTVETTTTTTTSGCAAVFPDGRPTGQGAAFGCYSPSLGRGYNAP